MAQPLSARLRPGAADRSTARNPEAQDLITSPVNARFISLATITWRGDANSNSKTDAPFAARELVIPS